MMTPQALRNSLKPGLALAAANLALLIVTGAASLAAWMAGLLIHRLSGIALPLLPAGFLAIAPVALALWCWLGRRARNAGAPLPAVLMLGLIPQAAAASIALLLALAALAAPRPNAPVVAGAAIGILILLASGALCAACHAAAAGARRN